MTKQLKGRAAASARDMELAMTEMNAIVLRELRESLGDAPCLGDADDKCLRGTCEWIQVNEFCWCGTRLTTDTDVLRLHCSAHGYQDRAYGPTQ